ncbi:stage IV sporulation protein A [Chryseomicrobium palamuruense]|uniref:Stage IV sporulation protein A n=1 Tax=Chryseomicrobium palamuruense TaxID=682973 RepID=A0ABV8UUS3_9BACL
MSSLNELAKRTHGDVYIGVVGPVRVGKSSFIKKLMEHLVLPTIEDEMERKRMIDELPQSSAGNEIMTTEPKFVPAQAASIFVQGSELQMKIRFVDCVGYMIDSIGNHNKLIQTPWHPEPIPFEQAARQGTDKVIQDHSTVGIVVSTDGTVNGLSREQVQGPEEVIVQQLKAIGKPFLLLINSESPYSPATQELIAELEYRYEIPVEAASVRDMNKSRLDELVKRLLFEFPIETIELEAPEWLQYDEENDMMRSVQQILHHRADHVHKLRDVEAIVDEVKSVEFVETAHLIDVDPASGCAIIQLQPEESLYEAACKKWLPYEVETKSDYLKLLREFYHAGKTYNKFSQGITEAIETGYGIAMPTEEDFVPYPPELIRENQFHGVRLRAKAPVIHMIRVDMNSEFAPLLGSEFHSQQLKNELQENFENDLQELWQTQLFGTTLIHVLQEGIKMKTSGLESPVKNRLIKTIEKIVKQEEKGLVTFII